MLLRRATALLPLVACGLLASYSIAADGPMVYAPIPILVVVGAVVEGRALRERGHGEAVERLLPLVAIALLAAGLT